MNALFVYSTKYERCNGVYYATSQTAAVWKERYLNIFDTLTVAGRVKDVDNVDGKTVSSTDGVEFHCTTLGLRPIEYFTKRKAIEKYISEEVKNTDFVIARQSFFSAIAVKYAKKYNKPYVVEVVGSSWDANWNYSLKGKLVAPYFELQAKRMIKDAPYVVYVTREFLQKEYPTTGKTIGISNVKIESIDESAIEKRLKRIENTDCKNMTLCTVAAVDVKYKGQAYVLKAMQKLKKRGYNLKYNIIGGGSQQRLKKLAEKYGVLDNVTFTGSIEHSKVYSYLDNSDVYIQPSLQEGLPRAMIEAMSRGMTSIGFRTAGIPELVAENYVCRRGSVRDICKCLLMLDQDEMKIQAQKNFESSKTYLFSVLNKNRESFIREAAGLNLKV